MVDNNEIQTQQTSFEEKMNKMFKEMDEERERFYKPYWKAKGAYSVLHRSIEMTEEHDKNWEKFLKDCPYWKDWRNNLGSFRKVSDLSYYCLRLSEIIQYKDKVSNYGFVRSREVLDKINEFAWRLVIMKRESFHKEFGGYFDKSTENYMINSNGTFFNSLFDNVDNNFIDKDDFVASITELGDDEEVIAIQDDHSLPNGEDNKEDLDNSVKNLTNGNEKRKSESDEGNNSRWSNLRNKLPRVNLPWGKKNKKNNQIKPYEEEYKLALWKRANWKDKDYRNNNETREGLEKWIKELEIKQDIDRWDFFTVDKCPALIHQLALDRGRGSLVIVNPSKVYYKDKDLSVEGWVRIAKEKGQSQCSKQVLEVRYPTTNLDNFPKSLIFVVLGLVALTLGGIIYKVRKNKFRVKKYLHR